VTSPAASTLFATRLLLAFVERGLSDVVLSPGARSQALALAAADLESRGLLKLHIRIDERSAAFVALGIGLETGRAAAVITTSGSAVGNLFPAVMEAHHSGVPMLLLTADRPAELRGIASNQTTRQGDFFGDFVRFSSDVEAPTLDDPSNAADKIAEQSWAAAVLDAHAAGPVHLNLAFRNPLSGGDAFSVADVHAALDRAWAAVSARNAEKSKTPSAARATQNTSAHLVLERGPRTIVIAGTGAGDAAEELAHEGSWPLIAEITSGSRFGRNAVPAYREALRDPELIDGVERVVVFGHPTLSREVEALLADTTRVVETIVVIGAGAENYNPGHNVTSFVESVGVASGQPDRGWLGAWLRFGHAKHEEAMARYAEVNPSMRAPDVETARSSDVDGMRAFAAQELAAAKALVTRELLVDAVWRATWPHDRLVFGASRLVRVADRTLVGKKVPVFANRGLAGIDGNVSTGVGIALASGALTRVLLGDLATLHDAGAMLIGPAEARPRIQVIVGNDGGGTIFDSLEVAETTDAQVIDRVFYTPHGADLEALAKAYDWEYLRVKTASELERAITLPAQGPQLLDVQIAR
jgi:2-succinyl-5-enolpyruvyl-6-hydroxy-3-cyclohexene-1-carboxylate synthase